MVKIASKIDKTATFAVSFKFLGPFSKWGCREMAKMKQRPLYFIP